MCDVYGEAFFSHWTIYKQVLHEFFTINVSWKKKTVYRLETYLISGNENVPSSAVSYEGHADSLLIREWTYHYCFPWKNTIINNIYYWQLRKKIQLIYEVKKKMSDKLLAVFFKNLILKETECNWLSSSIIWSNLLPYRNPS